MDHLPACLDDAVNRNQDLFAPFKLIYNSLPEIGLEEVPTAKAFAGWKISAPLIISLMTGGIGGEFQSIIQNMAIAAVALKMPLGLGTIKVMPGYPEAEAGFRMRGTGPEAKEWGASVKRVCQARTGPAGSIKESGEGRCAA